MHMYESKQDNDRSVGGEKEVTKLLNPWDVTCMLGLAPLLAWNKDKFVRLLPGCFPLAPDLTVDNTDNLSILARNTV